VIAYSVSHLVREIGIRMALGAETAGVQRLILGQGLRPVWAGLAVGLPASLAAARVLANLLYGVSAFDPPTLLSGTNRCVTMGAEWHQAIRHPIRRGGC
jgi:ABC-type antimicrobial peptide transport system permease subunit